MNLHAESDYFSPLTQKYLMRGKEDKGARFFSVVPSTGQQAMVTK